MFFEPYQARASHVMGSDITWKCVGKDSFIIEVTAYRNCKGIDLSATPISYKSACGGGNISAGGDMSGGDDITPVCKKSCTKCKNLGCEFDFGIQMYKIQTLVDLSKVNCCEFTISWSQCCRNADITTGAAGQDYYVEAKMNKCQKPCDNSPYFTNPPIAIYCVNQCIVFNPGVNDEDRDFNNQADSLAYRFTDPLSGAGNPIPFIEGYSREAPLKYAGYPNKDMDFNPPKCNGFHLDAETGDLQFKATNTDITVMSIAVDEYRKDSTGKYQKIGEIRRDLQIAIIECPDNRSPIITGINGGNLVSMDFCAGQSKCFTVHSFDPDNDDTVTMTWNKQIKGATFDVEEGKKWPKGQFCWTPGESDVRSFPYRFVVTAVDDACPVNARASKSFSIKVFASPEATYSATIGKCGEVTFKAFPGKKTAISKYEWSGSRGRGWPPIKATGNPITVKYPKPGKYLYNLAITSHNGCKTVYTDSLIIPEYVWLELPPDTAVCINSTIDLSVKRYLGKADYLYKWSIDAPTAAYKKDNTKITGLKITKDTIFWVKVKDAAGCDNYDSVFIHAQIPPKPDLGPDQRNCAGQIVQVDAGIGLPKQKSFEWYKYNGSSYVAFTKGQVLNAKDSGTYKVIVTDTVGCTGEDEITLYFNPLVDVFKATVKACNGEPALLIGGKGGYGTKWDWRDMRYLHLNLASLSDSSSYYIAKAAGKQGQTFIISYKVTAQQTLFGVTCKDIDTIKLSISDKPVVTPGKLMAQCIDNGDYNLNQVISKPNGGVWTYPKKQSAFVDYNVISPKILGVGNHWIRYTYTDPETTCKNTDSALLVVDTLPKVFAGDDTFLCIANGPMPLIGSPNGGTWLTLPAGGKGIQGSSFSPFFNPEESGPSQPGKPFKLIYRYQNKNSAKCDNEDTVEITVYDELKVTAGNYGPYCSVVEDELLGGTPAGGVWSSNELPATALYIDPLDGKYHFSPKKAGPGTYKLWYTASYPPKGRCPVTDTTYITVNPTPDVKLATADNKTQYCITDKVVKLNGTPAGGQYSVISGQGNPAALVGGSSFDPDRAGIGFHAIRYKYKDPNGCESEAIVNLQVTDTSWVQIQSAPKLCKGSSYQMKTDTFNVDGKITWRRLNANGDPVKGEFTPNENSVEVTYTPTADEELDGEFTLVVTSGNTKTVCAPAESQRKFIISPTPVAAFDAGPKQGCGPLGVTFVNQSHVDGDPEEVAYSIWNYGDGSKLDTVSEKTVLHYYRKPGIYTVTLTVISKANCKAELTKQDYIEVFITPIPNFRAKPTYTTVAMPKIEFINESDPTTVDEKTEWTWNFGDYTVADGGTSKEKNPHYLYRDTGKYTVTLTARNPVTGCDSSITKVAYINIRPEIIVYIPNAFTPGGIGKKELGPKENNSFKPVVSSISSYSLKVYNRWGELMFETDKPEIGWNGKYKEQDAQMDVYIYVIKAQSLSGKEYKYTGSITLIR